MAVSKRMRYEILRRDNHTCRYCGASAPEVKLTVDHVLPVALGGTDDPTNLAAACAACNSGKSSSNPDQPLIDQVSDDQLRWARAIHAAGEAIGRDRSRVAEYCSAVLDWWNRWSYTPFNGTPQPFPLPNNWADSIENFMRRGVPCAVLMEAVDIGARSSVPVDRKWRYAMGVAWKRQEEIDEVAAALLAVDGEDNG